MHHAWTIAWRPARCRFRSSKPTTILLGLQQAFSSFVKPQQHSSLSCNAFVHRRSPPSPIKQKHVLDWRRRFATNIPLKFRPASIPQKEVAPRAPSKLAFRRNDLRPYEVKVVFGPNGPSPALANTLLKFLHSRRVNGTLDLEFPTKLSKQLKAYPSAFDDALAWLRQEYPIDEDAAIIRRIEREEAGQGNEELIARAENLGLYKPQSGTYGAKLGEEGDIFGESELQRLRRENELEAEKEQEEVDEFIRQKQQAAEERMGALEAKRENGVEGKFLLEICLETLLMQVMQSLPVRGRRTRSRGGK